MSPVANESHFPAVPSPYILLPHDHCVATALAGLAASAKILRPHLAIPFVRDLALSLQAVEECPVMLCLLVADAIGDVQPEEKPDLPLFERAAQEQF